MLSKLTWFALYTRPRYEFKVKEGIAAMGIESYLPVQKTLKQWSDRKKWIEEPLFKSYCFVRVFPELYMIPLKITGVVRYVFLDGKPVIVRDSEIELIRLICNSEFPVEVLEKDFLPGEKIIISGGLLNGVEGEFIEKAGKRKVIVRIESISQALLVSVPVVNVFSC